MYLRVAFMMPLFFRVQTDTVIAKRRQYKRILLALDLLVSATLSFTTTYAIVDSDGGAWYVSLFWTILTVVMTGTFILSFIKIRHHTKGLAKRDSMGSKHLLYAHCVAFIVSSVCSVAH